MAEGHGGSDGGALEALRPRPTGGMIVTFREGVEAAQAREALAHAAGGGAAAASSAEAGAMRAEGRPVLLAEAGVGLVPAMGDEAPGVRARLLDDAAVAEVRPEFWMYPLGEPDLAFADTADATWGVQAVGADLSPFRGRGVRVCLLDTGVDAGHPDLAGRVAEARSFVDGEGPGDAQGHGTHCAGTVAGRGAAGGGVPRFGVAPEAELLVGKVLNDAGMGREGDILAGMLWAVEEGAAVISMSLGRPVQPGEAPSLAYERVGRLALRRGSLVAAAAGNESSRRFGLIAPVGAPANSPSILAVGAVDQGLGVAEFSCGGVNAEGGEVDLAGPGVGVLSAAPRARGYAKLRGTSMACPHVAGVAALWAGSDPGLRGRALWDRLLATARPLGLPARDVGAGLARAP